MLPKATREFRTDCDTDPKCYNDQNSTQDERNHNMMGRYEMYKKVAVARYYLNDLALWFPMSNVGDDLDDPDEDGVGDGVKEPYPCRRFSGV